MQAPLSTITAVYKQRLQQVAADSAAQMAERIRAATPVDTGRARNSWQDNGPLLIGKDYQFFPTLSYMPALENGHAAQTNPGQILAANLANWSNVVAQQTDKTCQK